MGHSNQFSIKAMLVVTAIVAVLCCIFFTLPAWVSAIFLLVVMLLAMPATLCAVVYGDGKTRAFAIGTLPPLVIIFFWFTRIGGGMFGQFGIGPGDSLEFKIIFAIVLFVVVASGFVGQATRWWCLPKSQPPSEDEKREPISFSE